MRVAPMILFSLAFTPLYPAGDNLHPTLSKMDQAAANFKSMSAKVRRQAHTAVINEDNVDTGMTYMKRSKRDVRMLVELTEPDQKSVALQGRKLEIYYPKIQTVEEYDVGKNRSLLDQFLLLGFGSSGKELSDSYSIKALGTETIAGHKTTRLELTPKSKDVLQHLKKVELWINDEGYPLQQKFYLSGGDYNLVTYTDLQINPDLPDATLKLKLPKGVKRQYPGK
jgi:outer membrane lipoprotein-sorting protein